MYCVVHVSNLAFEVDEVGASSRGRNGVAHEVLVRRRVPALLIHVICRRAATFVDGRVGSRFLHAPLEERRRVDVAAREKGHDHVAQRSRQELHGAARRVHPLVHVWRDVDRC